MGKGLHIAGALVSLCCMVSCFNEKDASDIVLLVTPSATVVAEGGNIQFGIETWSIHGSLSSIGISSFDEDNGQSVLHTESLFQDRYSGNYIYTAPDTDRDRLPVDITFHVDDAAGYSKETTVRIYVNATDVFLPEYSAISICSPFSGRDDGFNIAEHSTLSSSVASEERIDIYMYADPESGTDTFCPEWRTKTGVKFVRAGSYDYPGATASSLSAFYRSSVKADNVTAISNDDIIIVGRGDVALGVFRVISVYDGPGSAEDRIIVNFKSAVPENQ